MKFKFNLENTLKYGYLSIALLLVFWLITLFEFSMLLNNGGTDESPIISIFFKFINDFWAVFIIIVLLYPFYFLLTPLLKKRVTLIFMVLFAIIAVAEFALVKYSLTTLINLGADLLGYSFHDIYITVSSSESMSLGYFLLFLIWPLLVVVFYFLLKKKTIGRQLIGFSIVFVILFGSFKLMFAEASNSKFQNKLYYLAADIIKFHQNKIDVNSLEFKKEYPLLKPFQASKDVLAPFFKINKVKPTIVIIMVEGLGAEFMGGNSYSGFTPYLDSLIPKSLYWENFVSSAGRTFGVLPSLTASLPFGENGFLELPNSPSYISLISVLKANGYTTSYYSGDQSSFDKKINFLEYNGIDDVLDENKFGQDYEKTEANSGGFSWGYPDEEIFRKTLSLMDKKPEPRLDIIMTLSNHEPFTFPNKNIFEAKIDSILNSNQEFKIPKEDILAHKDIYASLYYTDNSIKNFMNAYAKRKEFENTIFIITGDHRLIPINQKDKLCRFHVPFYIYSRLLKKAEKFKSISSHFDVAPSLMSFLMNNYEFNKLDEIAWYGQGLDTSATFRNIHQIPLMRYKGSINDFIFKDYMYSDGDLYKINENFGTNKIIDEKVLEEMQDSLQEFKKINAYVTQKNKIFPDSLNIYVTPKTEFTKKQLETIHKLTKGLNFDQIFFVARDFAFDKKYNKAQLLCDYILNELPNHSDARTLKGRTLAWNGKYKEAEAQFLNVMKRSPFYEDSYLALMDLYWWSDQDEKSIELINKVKQNKINNPEITFKLAKAYHRLHMLSEANKLMDSILLLYPKNNDYKTFKNSLK